MYNREDPWDPRSRPTSGSSYPAPRNPSHSSKRPHPPPSPFDIRAADRTEYNAARYEPRSQANSKEEIRTPRAYQGSRDHQGRDRSASPVRERPADRPRPGNDGRRPDPRSSTPREAATRVVAPEKRALMTKESMTRDPGSSSRDKDVLMVDGTGTRASPVPSSLGGGSEGVNTKNHDTTQNFIMRLTETQRAFEKARDARDHLAQFQQLKSQRPLDPRETAEMAKKIEEKEIALREAERHSHQKIKSLRVATDAVFRESMKSVMGTQMDKEINGTTPIEGSGNANGKGSTSESALTGRSPAAMSDLQQPVLFAPVSNVAGPSTSANTPAAPIAANPAPATAAPPAPVQRSDVSTSRIKAKAAVADKLERLVMDMENMQSLVYTLEDNTTDREAGLRELIADLDRRAVLERRARHKDRLNHAEQRKLDLEKFAEVRAQDMAAHATEIKTREDAFARWREEMEAYKRQTDERFHALSNLGSQHLEALRAQKSFGTS